MMADDAIDTQSSSQSSSPSGAASGERAWDYLLRRKAEDISDRIHKTKTAESKDGTTGELSHVYIPDAKRIKKERVETDEQGGYLFPQQEHGSQTYATNRGFWIDTAGEWLNNEMPVRVKSEFGDQDTSESETSWRKRRMETQHDLGSGHTAAKKGYGHGRHVPANQQSEEALIVNIANYVQDARRTAKNSGSNELPDHPLSHNNGEAHQATKQSYGRNVNIQTLIHITPNDVQEPHHSRRPGHSFHSAANDEDLRHLLNHINAPAMHPSDPELTHNTANDDEVLATRQGCQKSKRNRTMVDTLPYPAEGVVVVYTWDPVEADSWLRNNIVDCSAGAVGFDIEWKPQFVSKRKGGVEHKTAVLQLAVESSCLVLHLYNMKRPPRLLASVLNDSEILKVGSGILMDVAKLKRDTGLKCIGLVDTQAMAKSVGIPVSQNLGLKALANYFLGLKLAKPKWVSRSNWEKFPLAIKQIHYAALDAWIGFNLYQHMKNMNGQIHNDQAEGCFAEDEVVDKPVTSYEETVKADPVKAAEVHICYVCNKKCQTKDGLACHIGAHPRCKCGKYFNVKKGKIPESHKKKCPLNVTSLVAGVASVETGLHQMNKDQGEACLAKNEVVDKSAKTISDLAVPTVPLKLGTIACLVCNKKVKSEVALAQHVKIHAQCKCGEYFQVKISKAHRKTCPLLNAITTPLAEVHSTEPGLCQGCGKRCKTAEKLMEHIRLVGHVTCPFCTQLLNGPTSTRHIKQCRSFASDQWKEFAK